jgi:hypothetical protein
MPPTPPKLAHRSAGQDRFSASAWLVMLRVCLVPWIVGAVFIVRAI